ncbi:hypothetical protein C5S31_09865, partial [ANME-1 cluster archaeon GoMg2]|nr:hypothetical protein [ANME-1 cluster archaeon GoMg2]
VSSGERRYADCRKGLGVKVILLKVGEKRAKDEENSFLD